MVSVRLSALCSALLVIGLGLSPLIADASQCRNLEPMQLDSKAPDDTTMVILGKNQVRKTISLSNVPGFNWNTEFAIPTGKYYKSYVARIYPNNNGKYNAKLSLKYSNGTTKTYYNKEGVLVRRDRPLYMKAKSGYNYKQVSSVNVYFGSPVATGKTYTIQVKGCR